MTDTSPTTFYRFRPISRLLGRPAVAAKFNADGTEFSPEEPRVIGELEGGYIFFSPPETLNDPFEGYTKFYWSGDSIIWTNFIKHYTYSLGEHYIRRLSDEDQSEIPTALIWDQSPFKPLYELVCNQVISEQRVKEHINELAYRERKISREELLLQLTALTPLITDKYNFLFHENGFIAEYLPIFDDRFASFSNSLRLIQRQISREDSDPLSIEDAFHRLTQKFKIDRFAYILSHREEIKGPRRNTVDYPAYYVERLPSLTHSPWYVACFMSSYQNSAIWGSYGENHRGACLIFESTPNAEAKPFLNLTVPAHPDMGGGDMSMPIQLQKVHYDDAPMELNFFECLSKLSIPHLNETWLSNGSGELSVLKRAYGTENSRSKYWDDLDKRLTTKWKDWSQENEYRIIMNFSLADFSDAKYRKIKYEFSALTGICFGAKTPIDDIIKLAEIIKELCNKYNRKDFDFYQAIHNTSSNSIEKVKIFSLSDIKSPLTSEAT